MWTLKNETATDENRDIIEDENCGKNNIEEISDDIEDDDDVEKVDIELPGKSESVEFTVFIPCKDHWLSKDQLYYTQELSKFSEIDEIENLWINSKSNYQVGTYLETNLKFQTKFASRFKHDIAYRQSIWNRLSIKETCPE